MISKPKVSVLMPVFNGAPYVSDAIRSIQGQSSTDWELIVIDDGSTDHSPLIIDQIAWSDKRIRVVHKEHSGLIDTLNLGLELARGAWLARLDQDDIADQCRIECQLAVAKHAEAVVLIGSNFSTLTAVSGSKRYYQLPSTHKALMKRLETMRGFFPHSSAFFCVQRARQLGGYDSRASYNEDWDLWLRLSEIGEITSVPRNLVTIRKHSAQMTANSGGICPQGESFVSTVLHFTRTRNLIASDYIAEKRDSIRDRVRLTREYQNYLEMTRIQELVRSAVHSELSWPRKLLRIVRLRISLLWLLRLISYVRFGTGSPLLAAKTIAQQMSNVS